MPPPAGVGAPSSVAGGASGASGAGGAGSVGLGGLGGLGSGGVGGLGAGAAPVLTQMGLHYGQELFGAGKNIVQGNVSHSLITYHLSPIINILHENEKLTLNNSSFSLGFLIPPFAITSK